MTSNLPLPLPSSPSGHRPSPYPFHKRSLSSPSSFFSFFFRIDHQQRPEHPPQISQPRTSSNDRSSTRDSPGADLRPSPSTRRRLLKRYSTLILEKMDNNAHSLTLSGEKDMALKSKNTKARELDYSHPHPHHLPPPHRQTSFSKRHASFDSPREVPLPSPSAQLTSYPFPNTVSSAHPATHTSKRHSADPSAQPQSNSLSHQRAGGNSSGDNSGDSSSISSPSLSSTQLVGRANTSPQLASAVGMTHSPDHSPSAQHSRDQTDLYPSSAQLSQTQDTRLQTTSTPVFPFSRPYSLPDAHSKTFNEPSSAQPNSSLKSTWIDRSSTASLPLPMQTPFNLLPRVSGSIDENSSYRENEQQSSHSGGTVEGLRPLPVPPVPSSPVNDSHSRPRSQLTSDSIGVPSSPPPPYSRFLSADPYASGSRSLSRTASTSSNSYPPPEAPVILSPPSPPTDSGAGMPLRAPYEPFLCHAPPPDTWIAVETRITEYCLLVRLPRFRRDGITLSTRRRRILHVVADSWEPGGGHFERRVSFGYDADLAQVRAEFDGELLRIIVPRRPSPATCFGPQG